MTSHDEDGPSDTKIRIKPRSIHLGNITIHPETRIARGPEGAVELTPTELSILVFISKIPGEIVSSWSILEHLYPSKIKPTQKVVHVHVCHVRAKLAGINDGNHGITTCGHRGYKVTP